MNNNSKFAAVITTINEPNPGMNQLLEYGKSSSAPVIVVGDTKTPESWSSTEFDYLSIPTQIDLFPEFAEALPTRHYARKNLGYLRARSTGAEWIYETDDDNIPTSSPFFPREVRTTAEEFQSSSSWLNIYECFGYSSDTQRPDVLWPRGFDLRSIRNNASLDKHVEVDAPVQQGLADGDPDVDAIYRLALGNLVTFNKRESIALKRNQICPTNSQTTWWHSSAQQLMYLPSTCTFRLTDILRGYVAWRILQERNETVVFHSPIVRQDRNEHDLLRDFRDEVELYLQSGTLIDDLLQLNLSGIDTSDQLVACYELLVNSGVVNQSELTLLNLWNKHF